MQKDSCLRLWGPRINVQHHHKLELSSALQGKEKEKEKEKEKAVLLQKAAEEILRAQDSMVQNQHS